MVWALESGIPDLEKNLFWIPDPGVIKESDPLTLLVDYAGIFLPSTCGSKDRNMEKISSFLW
jgi:hypothetical protein